MASKDPKRVGILALLGALGVFATLTIGSFFNYSSALMEALVGASLGAAFGDWRTIVILAVAGSVGFGVGLLSRNLLHNLLPMMRETGSIIITGAIGGTSLGAALGYLEKYGLSGGPRTA